MRMPTEKWQHVRRIALVVALATPALSRRARAQVARAVAVPSSLSGPVSVMWEDDFKHHTTRAHTMVFDRITKRSYEIHIDSATVRRLGGVARLSGMRAAISATPDGRVTAIRRTQSTQPAGTVPGIPLFTTRRVLVLLCRPSDGPTPYGSVQDYQNLWFNGSMSVAAFWHGSSDGQLTVTGDVLDWATLPGKVADYEKDGAPDYAKLAQDCEASIPSSVDLTKYDVVAEDMGISTPVDLGGYGDSVTIHGVTKAFGTAITGLSDPPATDMGAHAHEFGHALSLEHSGPANGFIYTSDWDVMSNASAYTENQIVFGAETLQGQKDILGYIPLARRFVATGTSSTITLDRAAEPSNDSNYLLAVIPVSYADSANDPYYTVELRQHAGFDRDLPLEGVVIHQFCAATICNWTFTTQDKDGNNDPNDHGAVLQAGESFVDKAHQISVTVASITGTSAQVTIRNGAGRSFAMSRTGAKTTVVEGAAAVTDSVAIALGGPGGASWSAANTSGRGQWLHVLTPSGTTSGELRFRRDVSQLAPGTYYDTLKVSSSAAYTDHFYYDTLVVTPGSALHLGLGTTARVDSNFAGIGQSDSTAVTISGPGASTAQWTATRKKSWGFISGGTGNLPTVSGTGNGTLVWSRVSSTTTPTGWYVDTITVKLTANPADSAVIFDSLLVVPPVQYSLSTTGRRDSIIAGSLPKLDSVAVSFSGLWATRASWSLTTGNRALRFLIPTNHGPFTDTYSAVGNATAYFQWAALDSSRAIRLEPGTYIDTLLVVGPFPGGVARVPDSQKEQLIIDTLVVYELSGGTALKLSSAGRVDTVAMGLSASIDSVYVNPVGTGADTLRWATPVYLAPNGQLTGPGGGLSPFSIWESPNSSLGFGGRGQGWLRYSRALTGLKPGTYAHTIRINSLDGHTSVTLYDTLVVVPGTALSLSQLAHVDTVDASAATPLADSVSLYVVGSNASSTAWTATKRRSFTTLTTTSGTGPATLHWTIDASSLAAGEYVDTISVSAGANARATSIVNTIIVRGGSGSSQIAAVKFDADSVGGILNYPFASTLLVNTGPINQSLGSYGATVKWDSTVVQLDSARAVSGGFAQPTVTQTNKASVTLSATDPSGKGGTVSLARLYFHFSASNVGKSTSITPSFTSAKTPGGTDLTALLATSSEKAVIIPGALRGDVNLDAKLTSADALLLLQHIVGLPGPGGGTSFDPNGDANCNGKIEAVDVQYILAKLVGLPTGNACVGTIK